VRLKHQASDCSGFEIVILVRDEFSKRDDKNPFSKRILKAEQDQALWDSATQNGLREATLRATDGYGDSAARTFTIDVTDARPNRALVFRVFQTAPPMQSRPGTRNNNACPCLLSCSLALLLSCSLARQ